VSRRADLLLSAATAALGLVLIVGGRSIGQAAGYDRIGPRTFPFAVAAALLLLAAALAASTFIRSRPSTSEEGAEAPPIDWRALGYIGVGLVLFLAAANRIGFVLAAAAQFWLIARAFQPTGRRPIRDAIAALVMAAVVYLVFSRALGLTLPAGILERLF
jgi:putative tricarboxylic transport membrane protein